MFKFISNVPISRRLRFAFLLAAIVPSIIIGILGLTFLNSANNQSKIIQTNINSLKATTSAEEYLRTLSDRLENAYRSQYGPSGSSGLVQTGELLKDVRTNSDLFSAAVKNYQQDYQIKESAQMKPTLDILLSNDPQSVLPDKQQNAISDELVTLWPNYKIAQTKLTDAIQNKAAEGQATPLMVDARTKLAAVRDGWDSIIDIEHDISGKAALVGPNETNPILFAVLVAFGLTLAFTFGIGSITFSTIIKPLQELSTLTERISNGETNARVSMGGRDEINRIADSMNTMLDNIVHLIQETQSQRDTLQAQVEKLVSEVSGVGEGDLRVQAEVTADALGVLADSFNYMVEELGSLVVRVKLVANEVESSTTTVLDRMTQLVETGDTQIKQIGDAVQEIEHMTASSRQVAERSQVLYEVARAARLDADQGREAVLQAIEGMGRINENVQTTADNVQTLGERSREINEIVEAISSIAHQTNRLALDAAIQAAMAGENGKGFGAVAADIRRLAERSKDQAGMIARIVRSVREDIGAVAVSMQDTERETASGARLTEATGISLRSIFSAVERQAHEVESINQMAMQQLQSSSAVMQIMHGVSETTQQNSLSTRDASQHMERLARLVEQLRASTEAFKLRDNQDYVLNGSSPGGSLEGEGESLISSTGSFRTVSSTIQSISGNSHPNLMPLPQPNDEQFALNPSGAPWQQQALQNGGWPEQSSQPHQWVSGMPPNVPQGQAWNTNPTRNQQSPSQAEPDWKPQNPEPTPDPWDWPPQQPPAPPTNNGDRNHR